MTLATLDQVAAFQSEVKGWAGVDLYEKARYATGKELRILVFELERRNEVGLLARLAVIKLAHTA